MNRRRGERRSAPYVRVAMWCVRHNVMERLSPPPRAELFARVQRPGWECFGDQLPKERTA